MNPPPTPVPRAPLPLRLLRSVVIGLLVLAFTLIAALWYLGATFAALETYFQDANKPPGAVIATVGGLVLLLPLGLAIWASRRHWLRWPVLAAASLVAIGFLAWLAWDEAGLRHPLTVDEVAPAFDGADRSYAVLMEYGKQHPTEEAKAFIQYRSKINFNVAAKDAEKWTEFITRNRAAIEADWAAGAPQRAWLARLNAFDRIGDLTPPAYDADIPGFHVWRFLSQRTCALASLQALDGHGDEAVATLMPMLEAARKFETSSRTLVRLMIARVVQRMCYETAGFILDRTNPGASSRARLLAAVADGNASAGARRIVQVEYALFTPMLDRLTFSETMNAMSWGGGQSVPRALNALTRFVINPHATANLYGDHVSELAALAEARDIGGFAARQQAFVHSSMQAGMKNLGGRLLLTMATPAYQKVVKNYWDIEDLRLALAARLQASK